VRPTVNEWDFIRYGTVSFGEKIIASDPPSGFLDPEANANVDRFLEIFDQPNYAYIDDITVEVLGGETYTAASATPGAGHVVAPHVIATRRREPPDALQVEDDPRILEILLDRPIPTGHTTKFIFNDGQITNVIRYTLQWGDTDGNGSVDLLDVATFQNCFGLPSSTGHCAALDSDRTSVIDDQDTNQFLTSLIGPIP
jgi:hypothetical protein